jgi:hypothetical protein
MAHRDCWYCGLDEAVLTFDATPVCRDCFAGCVAGMFANQLTDDDEATIADVDAAYESFLERGYEDADTVLNGGRLPY